MELLRPPVAGSGSGIYLKPGDFRFYVPELGVPRPLRLHTLLGSCISVILWHPERKIGGMSHVILPERGRKGPTTALDARYCDESLAMFQREVIRAATRPAQYLTYLVGGGRMYESLNVCDGETVGERNIESARAQLKAAGFLLRAEDVGREGYRKVEIDLATGAVTVLFGTQRKLLSG